jgi:tricorn protease-like protein
MKIKLITSLVVFVLFSVYANSQTITKLNQNGSYANFTPNGENIVFSGFSFKGLKIMDLNSSKVEVLNEEPGAGYNPVINNEKVFFSTRRNKQQVIELDLKTKSTKVFNQVSKFAVSNASLGKKSSSLPIEARSSNDLSSVDLIYADGISNQINIEKDKNKVWVSLSPDRTKILYTVVGQKTFIIDLKGNVLASLERAEAPKWANNNTIVYMLTQENIDFITDGDIYTFSLTTKKSTSLTSKFGEIALYPAMSVDESKVVFNNDKGELFLINLTK